MPEIIQTILYIFFSLAIIPVLAEDRHRNVVGWMFLSLVISPYCAGAILLFFGPKRDLLGLEDNNTQMRLSELREQIQAVNLKLAPAP
ncbi:MAG: hypothetical protein ABJ327_03500 [Litoreibacter sp.]